jgi:twitching motility protein PilT
MGARIDSFLRLVVEQQVSDLHFHGGNVPIIRYHGDLMPLPFRSMSDTEARRFLMEMLTPEQRETFETERDVDFVYDIEGVGRFRANVFMQNQGIGAVFRVIPNRLPTIDELQFSDAVKKLTRLNNGLVLVTGPTGCGKTTTLAAIVHEINRCTPQHIITVEDPIEFIHEPVQSVISQRQVGKHTSSFAEALRSALRESPDVLIIGELRDLDTIQLAIAAAETGVLVFGTLHSNSASKAVDRMIHVLPEESRDQMRGVLSVLLRGVVAQHLIKLASGEGRTAVMEILLQSFGVSHMIRENKLHQIEGYLQSASHDGSGMQSLDHAIFCNIREGLISLDEGLKVSNYPDILKRQVADLPEDF